MKTRPPKKNPKLLSDLIKYIRQGHTIRDACRFCGISTTTFNRWRDKDLKFNKDVIMATKDQWKYAPPKTIYSYRRYNRRVSLSTDYDKNAFKGSQNALESSFKHEHDPTTIQGIPVRFGSIYDDRPYIPCVDPKGLFVTFIENQGAIAHHRCYTLEEWLSIKGN